MPKTSFVARPARDDRLDTICRQCRPWLLNEKGVRRTEYVDAGFLSPEELFALRVLTAAQRQAAMEGVRMLVTWDRALDLAEREALVGALTSAGLVLRMGPRRRTRMEPVLVRVDAVKPFTDANVILGVRR